MFTTASNAADCNNNNSINSKGNNGPPNRITSTYNSELDIYGNSQRLKKSLLWSSLRKPKKIKGTQYASSGQLIQCQDFYLKIKSD